MDLVQLLEEELKLEEEREEDGRNVMMRAIFEVVDVDFGVASFFFDEGRGVVSECVLCVCRWCALVIY